MSMSLRSDRCPDGAQHLRDLAAEEDQGNDGDDGDKNEDECVFGEALTLLAASEEGRDKRVQTSHEFFTSFPDELGQECPAIRGSCVVKWACGQRHSYLGIRERRGRDAGAVDKDDLGASLGELGREMWQIPQ